MNVKSLNVVGFLKYSIIDIAVIFSSKGKVVVPG